MNSQKEIGNVLEDWIINLFTHKVIPLIYEAAKGGAEAAVSKPNQKNDIRVKEAAELLNVSTGKIFGMLKSGQLDRIRIPGNRYTYVSTQQLKSLMKTFKPYKRNG